MVYSNLPTQTSRLDDTDCVGGIYWKYPSNHTSRSCRDCEEWVSLSHCTQRYCRTPHSLHFRTASLTVHLQHNIGDEGGEKEHTVLVNIVSLIFSQFSSRFSILFCHVVGPVSSSCITDWQSLVTLARSKKYFSQNPLKDNDIL